MKHSVAAFAVLALIVGSIAIVAPKQEPEASRRVVAAAAPTTSTTEAPTTTTTTTTTTEPPAPEPQRDLTPAVEHQTKPPPSSCGDDFACFKACTLTIESGGDYGAVSSGGTYRGAWQFDQRTWDSNAAAIGRNDLVGVDPASASPADQDAVALTTYQSRGNQPWGGRC